jgi:hypothetical protein
VGHPNNYVEPRAWVDQDQEWFDDAVARLLMDVLATTGLRPGLEVDLSDPDHLSPPYRFSREAAGSGYHGHALDPPESEADAVVKVADLLVDDVIEQLWGAWPICPGHGHPAEARVVADEAMWVCPQVGVTIARVGELQAP